MDAGFGQSVLRPFGKFQVLDVHAQSKRSLTQTARHSVKTKKPAAQREDERPRPSADTVHKLQGKKLRIVTQDGVIDIAALMKEIIIEDALRAARNGNDACSEDENAAPPSQTEGEKKN